MVEAAAGRAALPAFEGQPSRSANPVASPVANPVAAAAVTELANAKVGLLLPVIWPLEHEKHFWTSDFFLSAAEDHDTLHLFMRLIFEGLILFRLHAGVPADIVAPFRALTSKVFSLVLVHIAVKVVAPHVYMQCRWITVVAHFRWVMLPS
jgi:hypothetical protein